MKSFACLVASLTLAVMSSAQTNLPGDRPGPTPAGQPAGTAQPAKSAAKLKSNVYEWSKLEATPTSTGSRRAVLDGPTSTLDHLHCHISTLNPGEKSGEPHLHLQEEVIIVKEGTVEASSDGVVRTAPAGSVIFFAAHSVTFLRNAGTVPAVYTVVYYYTPLTPKE